MQEKKVQGSGDELYLPKICNQIKEKQYSVISYQERLALIELVCQEGYSIGKAALKLKIKKSTAKYIVKCYRKTRKVMKKVIPKKKNFQKEIQHLKGNNSQNLKEQYSSSSLINDFESVKVENKIQGQKINQEQMKQIKNELNQEIFPSSPSQKVLPLEDVEFFPIYTPEGFYFMPVKVQQKYAIDEKIKPYYDYSHSPPGKYTHSTYQYFQAQNIS